MSRNWKSRTARWWPIFTPPPDLTVSEWADAERQLSPEASAEPGRWVTARAEYQRGIMDAVSDRDTHTVVAMTSAQVGKTETLNNVVGFFIDQDPSPMLVVQPTLDMAKAWSQDRLAPMLRDTPALHGKIKDARSRDSGNTMLHKQFPGGHITMAGANSAASLASRPIRVVLADEVDRYPESAGTEGDPVSLARKRTTTFWNRKQILTSTPTVKGESRIEEAYNESDQRRFHVCCHECGHEQTLKWSQVRWASEKADDGSTVHHAKTAEYACEECGVLWNDAQRWKAVSGGRWIASAPFRGVAGFHLNELYSPWVRLADTVEAFINAKESPERLKTFVNTALGETWEETGRKIDEGALRNLVEVYGPDMLPEDVLYLTAGVDTQDDRLEVELVGWGAGEKSWGVRYSVLPGDPAQQMVWDELDDLLLENAVTESGRQIRVAAAAVDSGGHHAEAVHRFCRERLGRRVYAIKGQGGQGRPVWPVRGSKAKTRDTVYMVGVDTAKDMVAARWAIEEGPGQCRLPADPELGYDEDWLEQVTSEERMTRYREGRPYTVWVLPKGKRNEALDCRVYATAAMKALPVASRRRAEVETQKTNVEAGAEAPAPKVVAERPRRRRGNSFLGTHGWSL